MENNKGREFDLAASYMKMVDEMIYAISHDFMAPIRHVGGFARLLKEHDYNKLSPDGQSFLDATLEAAHRLDLMGAALLTWSRINRKEDPHLLVPLDKSLDRAIRLMEPSAIQVTHGPLPSLWLEPSQLTNLWNIVVANAVKFRHAERLPTLDIKATRTPNLWEFRFADNGVGIAERDFERVFEMFSQLGGRGTVPGVGAGLAIARRIAERYGGVMKIESSSHLGTTIYLGLPTILESARAD